MKHLCCIRFLFLVFFLSLSLWGSINQKSAVVYYGDDLSYTLVGIHDYIIVQPEHVDTYQPGFKSYCNSMYAYVSIGEVEKGQPYYSQIKKEWMLGENKLWHAAIADISNKAYRDFLFSAVIEPIRKRGFKNFFLDTLDSYMIVAQTPEEKEKMRQGLIKFIHSFHIRYPDAKLIINRGFKIIDEVHSEIEAVLVESLFEGLSNKDLSYKSVSEEDRNWLIAELEKLKQYKLPVIIVDYVEPQNKKRMKQTVQKIEKLGFIPYVADRHLKTLGMTSKEALKREVLLLYDGTEFDGTDNDNKQYSTAFLELSMPLEYLGYVPKLYDVAGKMPSDDILRRYAGAVIWLTGNYAGKYPKVLERWISNFLKNDVKILLLETLAEKRHNAIFKKLHIGLKRYNVDKFSKYKFVSKQAYVGYEMDPFTVDTGYLLKPKDAKAFCTIERGKHTSVIGAIMPWGGYVSEGAVVRNIADKSYWIMNPFKVIKDTLRLPDLPAPDPTTENGKRLLFSHVDGDGIMNRAEWDQELFSGEVLYQEIWKRYSIPQSVSIIEAETAPYGLYPKLSDKLEAIARKIFALDHVEAATHTFTHPFYWEKIVNTDNDAKYRLNVKDYHFSVDREINGSLTYINTKLAPKNKPTKMTFWSGDCNPPKSVLKYMYQHNYLHINGGDTMITNAEPLLSLVAPYGIEREGYYQVYTGAQNENVYTNDWLGPFWGFKKVIQTFKLTDKPRRLKPIDIYYHIYSGSKRASLNALHKVYQWAMKQDVMPIYISEYIPKVIDFYTISMIHEGNSWLIKGANALKTVRIPDKEYVDMIDSHGIAGYKKYNDALYIHLAPKQEHLLVLGKKKTEQNYLLDANVALKEFRQQGDEVDAVFNSYVPAKIRYHLEKGCELKAFPKEDKRSESGSFVTISYQTQKDVNVSIQCK